MGNDVRLQLCDKPPQPPLILVFLLGAGLWRWRVGWGQVRTARRLDPRAAVVEYTLANHATIKKLFDVDGKYLPRCGIL